ncbi:MAG: esterase/lipase family protein [Planctomycetota bacterium]|jgi:hypothetical protein
MRSLALFLLLVACAGVGVERRSGPAWYRDSRRVVMDGGEVSTVTLNMLRRRGLAENHRQDPVRAIEVLQAEMRETHARDLCVAIAELAYLQEKRTNNPDRRALGTTLRYAYAYLFDPRLEPAPIPYDAQFRWACDLYSTSLADLVRQADREKVHGQDADRWVRWYGGEAPIEIESNELHWDLDQFDDLRVAYDIRVAGLPAPDSRRGFGVPCVLRHDFEASDELDVRSRYLPKEIEVAATVIARFPDGTSVLDAPGYPCLIDIVDPGESVTARIEGREIPLEFDLTTPIAAYLAGRQQNEGVRALLNPGKYEKQGGLYTFQPIRRDKLLVLFIHGLASDPSTWVPLYNDLMSNETIRTRCQFAFWFYPTGQPIFYSAWELRTALRELLDQLAQGTKHDVDGQILVCGHSMGGLLAHTLVSDSGMQIWDAAFSKRPDVIDFRPDSRKIIEESLIFEKIPNIKRVIFYATPHRGSPRAQSVIANWLAGLTSMPKDVRKSFERARRHPDFKIPRLSTSVRALSPDNPVLRALVELPIEPPVKYHSIVGTEDPYAPYDSAHLDGAASELKLPVGHSVQKDPRATRETRRIVLEHIAAFDSRKRN